MMIKSIVLFFLVLMPGLANAYPDFIGYGYRSCLVCHESGSGGGALTDYGRGVFASEIAANPFPQWLSDEDNAEISNFLGRVELPWWIRLGIKYRALTVEKSPGSTQSRKFHFNMQNELNFNLFADEAHTKGLITTLGYIENPRALAPNKTINEKSHLFMREYFLKYNLKKEFWLYAGFMDKVFGIKTADHTSVNRSPLSLGQYDQVHAVLLQWARKNEDLFFQIWNGNLHLTEADRRVGGSFMLDQKWGSAHAYGFGLLSEKKKTSSQNIIELHNKMGFGDGNSLMMELGYRQGSNEIAGVNVNASNYYLFTQSNINITRGVFLLSGIETAKATSGSSTPESLRWDLGLMVFPIQKMELRLSGVNQKIFGAPEAVKDQWSIQSQIHLSL